MKNYVKLLRTPHYLKNVLIFIPLFFNGRILESSAVLKTFIGFIAFCFLSSSVYIINDINDCLEDRKHETKCNRPIASGCISKRKATYLSIILFLLSLLTNYFSNGFNFSTFFIMIIYFVMNVLYSFGLKNIPILDVVILVSGFLLRIYYGSAITGIPVSNWLYLSIMSISFYLGLGKRRNELLKANTRTRKVLNIYTKEFLDKNMYLFLTTAIVFYSLWCIDATTISVYSSNFIIWTIPLVLIICMKYNLDIEINPSGDPVEVILKDRLLLIMVMIYSILMFLIIY